MMRLPFFARTAALLPIALLACLHGSAGAEDKPAYQVSVKVVTMAVTVRDKHGEIVNNLKASDFSLLDNTHPQTIQYFTHDTDLPLTLGLLVDTSMSQRAVLGEERISSEHFFNLMLTQPKDKAFLVSFEREVDLLADPTSQKETLQQALGRLGSPSFGSQDDSSSGGGDDSSGGHHRRGGGTALYDAIYLASTEVQSKLQGRKALIVLTDGVDRGSKETLTSAIEAAQRANTVVYAIYFKGEEPHMGGGPGGGRRGGMGGGRGGGWPGSGGGGWPGGSGGGGGGGGGGRGGSESHADGKKILEQICAETGGRMYEGKKDKTDEVYSKIAEELRGQYQLGYTPSKDASDSGYHKIALTAKNKDLLVQTREGYYAEE